MPEKHFNETHGGTRGGKRTPEWTAWHNMRARCMYECTDRFEHYGGRGIYVCPQWNDRDTGFVAFLEYVGCRPTKSHTIGRKDNNGNYEPGNVEWQLGKKQARNKSDTRYITALGKTQSLADWEDETGIAHQTIFNRIKNGWDTDKAVSTPPIFTCDHKPHLLTLDGRTMRLSQWAKETGIGRLTIYNRLMGGWTVDHALTRPVSR